MKDRLIVIDGNALIHRAYHALPPMTHNGKLLNAVYGFTSTLFRVIKELKPKYVIASFDLAGPTFRHEEYKEYKAKRIKAPDELYEQIPLVKELVAVLKIPIYTAQGFEADDIIGTVVTELSKKKDCPEIIIVTGDKDTLQLVTGNVKVYTFKQGINDSMLYDPEIIKEKFGLEVDQLIDYKALRGDPSDNIPGVKGIGEKTATELLQLFKTLDGVYQAVKKGDKKIKERIKDLLLSHKEEAIMSKQLATIRRDVPIHIDLRAAEFGQYDKGEAIKKLQEFNFKTIITRLADLPSANGENGQTSVGFEQRKDFNYILVTEDTFFDFYQGFKKQKEFSLDTETTGLKPRQADLVGLSVSWKEGEAYFIPKAVAEKHKIELTDVLVNTKIKKIGHNIKFDSQSLRQFGLITEGIATDTMVAAYLLSNGERNLSLDAQVLQRFGYETQPIEDLIGPTGKNQLTMDQVPLAKVSWYAAEDADWTLRLWNALEPELKKQKMLALFKDIEMPLVPVLAEMEYQGVKLDIKFLKEMSKDLAVQIDGIANKIYKQAGREFNISSPLQLKEILFDDLQIPTEGLRKIKTGVSTAASELEKMKGLHPIINLIGQYRELTKLQTTYVEALPDLINPKTGRVHTSYNQTVTATGRLSSSDPNLQNIPIRTEIGKEIRKGFIADKGNVLLSADYSQIELRIVAALAKDKTMLKVFKDGGDIHLTTAMYIHDLPKEKITEEIRRTAKEVNFGVMYGMGAFGLAERTGLSRQEAAKFIEKYFHTYPAVKKYIDKIIADAREIGYVETYFGRRRYIPDLLSSNFQVRNAAERQAVNMPMQGTAADIIKLAMIKVYEKFKNKEWFGKDVKMLLQVHDELVFEVKKEKVKEIAKEVKKIMETVVDFPVPLAVDTKVGVNWGEMEKL
ncbi:MAG: DNA polymerase I [bacterium]